MSRSAMRAPAPGYSDDTGPRIRAYLASMRPLRGVADITGMDAYQRGRSLIERMALLAVGTDLPRMKLTTAQCADVLAFLQYSEPVEPRTWWEDPKDAPSHLVGHYLIIDTLATALHKGVRS